MSDFNRKDVIEILKEHIHCVAVFINAEGKERTLNCTLNQAVLPEKVVVEKQVDINKPETPKKFNELLVSVYDIDESKWKSFRLDRLISITHK